MRMNLDQEQRRITRITVKYFVKKKKKTTEIVAYIKWSIMSASVLIRLLYYLARRNYSSRKTYFLPVFYLH